MKLTTFLCIVITEVLLTLACILAIGLVANWLAPERKADGEWPQIRRVDR